MYTRELTDSELCAMGFLNVSGPGVAINADANTVTARDKTRLSRALHDAVAVATVQVARYTNEASDLLDCMHELNHTITELDNGK